MPGLRKISFLTYIFEDDQGRMLTYLPNYGHPRIVPDQTTVRRLKRFVLAENILPLVAIIPAAYFYGIAGLLVAVIFSLAITLPLKCYVFRSLPVADDIAPAWQQMVHRMPIGLLIAILFFCILFLGLIVFVLIEGFLDATLTAILGAMFFAMSVYYAIALRFKWRHRHTSAPGIATLDIGRRGQRRLSEGRFWLAASFLFIFTGIRYVEMVLSPSTTANELDAAYFLSTVLSLAGFVAILRFVLMTSGKVRYGHVVATAVATGLGFKVITLPILIGPTVAISALLEIWWIELLFWTFIGSILWLAAFYRNCYFFPNEDHKVTSA